MEKRGTDWQSQTKSDARWHVACELLKARRYEQVAEILHEAQQASERAGDAILAHLLSVARRLCLVGRQCLAEVEWHHWAHEEAAQRESELWRQLNIIIDLVSKGKPSGIEVAQSVLPTTDPFRTADPAPKAVTRSGFWHRILSLLQRGLLHFHVDREMSFLNPAEARVSSPGGADTPPLSHPKPGREVARITSPGKVKRKGSTAPSLIVYCLGSFEVYQDGQSIQDWPSNKGKSIFKYLVTHRERPVAKEVLMELFWASTRPDAARNNLNVAIYGLRQALRRARPSFSHVLFQDDCYLFHPDLQIWVDCEAFMEHFAAAQALERRGEVVAAIRQYHAADVLYQGEFLEGDRYEDWPFSQRQRLQDGYLSLLDRLGRYYFDQEDYTACATICRQMLAVDSCREEAYRRLMRCYSRQGQPYLALRQYHLCVEKLKDKLDVAPAQATTALYKQILQSAYQ